MKGGQIDETVAKSQLGGDFSALPLPHLRSELHFLCSFLGANFLTPTPNNMSKYILAPEFESKKGNFQLQSSWPRNEKSHPPRLMYININSKGSFQSPFESEFLLQEEKSSEIDH